MTEMQHSLRSNKNVTQNEAQSICHNDLLFGSD